MIEISKLRPEDWIAKPVEVVLTPGEAGLGERILALAEELERLDPWKGSQVLPEAEAAYYAFQTKDFEVLHQCFGWARIDPIYCGLDLLMQISTQVEDLTSPHGLFISDRNNKFGLYKELKRND